MTPYLFLQILSIEAKKRMSYRVDFWINTLVGFLASFGVAYFVAYAIFQDQAEISGFTRDGLILYYAAVLLIEKLMRGPEFGGDTAEDIYQGGLTRYLLFPTGYVPFKYAQHLGALLPLVIQAILFGILAAIVLDIPADVRVTPASVAACAVAVLMANLLHFLIRLPLQMIAFWQDNVWSLSVALRFVTTLLGGAMIPLAFFPEWGQKVLYYLPFRLLLDWPTRALLGRMDAAEWWTSFAWALVWCVVAAAIGRAVWRRGDLQYTGVGI